MSLNDILKKISQPEKTELAKHEIELGSIQDLEKRVEQFASENKQVVDLIKSLDSVKSKFKQLDKKIASDFKLLRDDSEKLFKQASDLGIETKIPFQLGAKVAKLYGENWDMDAINFLRK
jgi:Rad3-related DNA helicase